MSTEPEMATEALSPLEQDVNLDNYAHRQKHFPYDPCQIFLPRRHFKSQAPTAVAEIALRPW